jgi:hypothetical protein
MLTLFSPNLISERKIISDFRANIALVLISNTLSLQVRLKELQFKADIDRCLRPIFSASAPGIPVSNLS